MNNFICCLHSFSKRQVVRNCMVCKTHFDSCHSTGVGNRPAALRHSIICRPYVKLNITEVIPRFLIIFSSLRRMKFSPKKHPQQILLLCMYEDPLTHGAPSAAASASARSCYCVVLEKCITSEQRLINHHA